MAVFAKFVVFGDKQWTVPFRYRHLLSAGRKSNLLEKQKWLVQLVKKIGKFP
jgi:hypothetical protein